MAKPAPHLLLGVLRHRMQYDFPVGAYYESVWASWEDRIKQGHQQEEARLAEMYEAWEGHPDAPDWAADENYMIGRATRSMYAALVVAIWSQCERTLGHLCRLGSGKSEYRFEHVQLSLQKSFSIQLEVLPDFYAVDGLRIINNSFKHNDGVYTPDQSKPWTVLDPSFISGCPIRFADRKYIAYEDIRFDWLINGCGRFLERLMDEIKPHLPATLPPSRSRD